MPRYTIEDMMVLAKRYGGECLSTVYKHSHNVLEWRCAEGHQWKSTPTNILQGNWCARCKRISKQANYFSYLKEYARSKGGDCLSNEFIRSIDKLLWQCRYGHKWEATSTQVVVEQRWCRLCGYERQKDTLANMQELARRKGGECLSIFYENANEKLRWKCEKGHIWDATPTNIKWGSWCPCCAFNIPNIEKMKTEAQARGGNCLSKEYINTRTKLQWICKLGHTWMATPNSILSRKSWCPQCAILASCRNDKVRRKYLPDDSTKG